MILSLLVILNTLISIKPCDAYCCTNIKQSVTVTGAELLIHGLDCPIAYGTKMNERWYILNTKPSSAKNCWYCNGEKLNYDITCTNYCCKVEGYILDKRTGGLHTLHCKTLDNMNIMYCKFLKKSYNIIDGFNNKTYTYICTFCLPQILRIY